MVKILEGDIEVSSTPKSICAWESLFTNLVSSSGKNEGLNPSTSKT